jgi:hypothetical protein
LPVQRKEQRTCGAGPLLLVPVTGLEPVRCRQRRILSLVSHDFLHFLPHRSTAESPCNSVVFGLFCIFKKTSICKKKHIWGELGQN